MPNSEVLKEQGAMTAADRPYQTAAEKQNSLRGKVGLGQSQALGMRGPGAGPRGAAPAGQNTVPQSPQATAQGPQPADSHPDAWALQMWERLAMLPGASPFIKQMAQRMREHVGRGSSQ